MQNATYPEPSDQELRQQALLGLQQRDPRSYKDLQAENGLEKELDERVQDCRDLVRSLVKSGVPRPMAWDQARREVLALQPQN